MRKRAGELNRVGRCLGCRTQKHRPTSTSCKAPYLRHTRVRAMVAASCHRSATYPLLACTSMQPALVAGLPAMRRWAAHQPRSCHLASSAGGPAIYFSTWAAHWSTSAAARMLHSPARLHPTAAVRALRGGCRHVHQSLRLRRRRWCLLGCHLVIAARAKGGSRRCQASRFMATSGQDGQKSFAIHASSSARRAGAPGMSGVRVVRNLVHKMDAHGTKAGATVQPAELVGRSQPALVQSWRRIPDDPRPRDFGPMPGDTKIDLLDGQTIT